MSAPADRPARRIRLLPDDVAQKIAAGEVIERPVSVVKELVENALDAGAASVRVELADGGKTLIKVQDDGSGMSREDAALCFRRHSTSKIWAEADLERIATLGFRGEALASISAVSRLVLRTYDGFEERGTMIEREGEKLLAVTDLALPRGTTVEVRDLFWNLPARRKFLRSNQSELGLIVKYMTQAALADHRVKFGLVHGTREVIHCPAVGTLGERIFQLFGKAAIDGLMEVAAAEGPGRAEGFTSLPLRGRRDRSFQHFFVNRRPVKDRILLAALNQAYTGILERNRFPEAILFLTLPYEDVDVNVHPAKAEVRFRDSQAVFRLVALAIRMGIGRGHTIKGIYPLAEERGAGDGVAEGPAPPGFGPGSSPEGEAIEPGLGFGPLSGEAGGRGLGSWPAGTRPGALAAPARDPGRPEILGQYENLYIVAGGADGLLVIDQHNAHERVLFDKYREIDRQKAWPRKMLLIPVLQDLSPSQIVSLEEEGALLEEMGFVVEAMGGRSFALKEYPDIFRAEEAGEVFLSLLEEAGKNRAEDRREKFLATLACKTAVKAGQPLTREKMGYLIEELFRTSQPALCPHGRPIIVRIDKSEIDKGLRR